MFMTNEKVKEINDKNHILAEGKDLLPSIEDFEDMNLPKEVLRYLNKIKITQPFPIQMLGIPVALARRDSICISPSGLGKTLVYLLNTVLVSLEEEIKLQVCHGEGPFAMILIPSHELAIQIYDQINQLTQYLKKKNFPQLKSMLCIGGTSLHDSLNFGKNGFHIMVGTPGRISDMLKKQQFSTDFCQYLVLDEADRLLDMTFENDLSFILNKFKNPRQTMLFSSTMPKTVQNFAKQALNNPILINVEKQSINLNVIQDIEYVKQEQKILYLLEVLQKTKPQVIIFTDKIQEVDYITEYLMLKGIKVVSLHGQKRQQERTGAYQQFQKKEVDVLVATDIAGKGLDFSNIKHVINYEMTKDIESYIHRIGRTGRQGKQGVSTTFINKNQELPILTDLKALLVECKQRIPTFLQNIILDDDNEGCGFCGGKGHKIQTCGKMEMQKMKSISQALLTKDKEKMKL